MHSVWNIQRNCFINDAWLLRFGLEEWSASVFWHPGSSDTSHIYHDPPPRKSRLCVLSVLMAKWIPHLHWLPNQPFSAPWETLTVTSTLPRESAIGSICFPVKLTLQNGKTQNEVTPPSSALIIETLGEPPRNRKGKLCIKYNRTIILYDIVRSIGQVQHRSLGRKFPSLN